MVSIKNFSDMIQAIGAATVLWQSVVLRSGICLCNICIHALKFTLYDSDPIQVQLIWMYTITAITFYIDNITDDSKSKICLRNPDTY